MSCEKAHEVLDAKKIEIVEQVDARKVKLGTKEAEALLKSADILVTARGNAVREIDLRGKTLPKNQILALIMGPTGNLRAPTLRVGKKLYVGFNAERYKSDLN